MSKITIGTDPEFFMKNEKTGNLVSAIPYIKGDKENPVPLAHGGNIQSDNVAIEFATKPMKSADDFVAHMKETFKDTLAVLPNGFNLEVAPSAIFPALELAHPKAKEFGCSPDYCAWDLMVNEPPAHPDERFRSCGGHVHVGCIDEDGNPTHEDAQFLMDGMGKVNMVRGMDLFLGVISTILDNSKEAIERRTLYGKAGCHRPTDYGVEYRTLSNWWTKTPYSTMLITYLTEDVVEVIINNKLDELIESVGESTIRDTINNGDVTTAKRILEDVLMAHLSEDSKFYLEECTNKLEKSGNIAVEWGV